MSQAGITIVPMKMKYVRSFRAVLDSVCKERKFLIFLQAPPMKQVRQFVSNLLRRGDIQVVALKDNRVVGWCDIVSPEWPGFEGTGRLGMGLAREFRGQGLGPRIAKAAIEAAVQKGFRRIELDVYAVNEPAIKLYQKLGFVVEGRKMKARCLDGEYYDIIQMAFFP